MNRFTLSRGHPPGTKRPARARPVLELLEDRTVLNSYTAATVARTDRRHQRCQPYRRVEHDQAGGPYDLHLDRGE